ncbi:MAG: histidine kinase [Ginsengibacter sp.]
MIKDKYFRRFFIPLLGIIIPFLSGVVTYKLYSSFEIAGIFIYFIFMSWCIWTCAAWVHGKIRNWFTVEQNIFFKISAVSLINAQFAGSIAAILTLFWFKISEEHFAWVPYLLCVGLSLLGTIIFALVYEIMYLSKERELDTKIVYEMDRERNFAEISNLKNELEPHFIFNSLTALSHLILNDSETAHIFNGKLATIFKYFLINKEKEMISLYNELEFLDDYFYLLKLRHDNHVKLFADLNVVPESRQMIVPFALQIAVENAIKHNEFSADSPLKIYVELHDNFMLVKNKIKLKSYPVQSTGIGLRNLKLRYQLFWQKEIIVKKTHAEFIVQLPIISKQTP